MSEKLPLVGDFVLVIHGGAGTMSREGSTPEQRQSYRQALREALRAGYRVLENGGEALDAAVAAVTVLEDCPLFNAGKGAVFNVAGQNELEASVMVSKPPTAYPAIPPTRRGIGLTLLTQTKNPSHLARQLYLDPVNAPHTFLSGAAAEQLSQEPLVEREYFFSERRWREHRRGLGLPEQPLPPGQGHEAGINLDLNPKGTVGATALDTRGCLAAVTSTGGRTNKSVGRIGDTPMMGSGYWAEEWNSNDGKPWIWKAIDCILGKPALSGVAVSGTGDGDYFIRQSSAVSVAHRMKFLGQTLESACQTVVDELARDGGDGGVIAVDRQGNVALRLNCPGMYRGMIRKGQSPKVAIFADEELE